jgi:hypothetical protein
MQNKNITLILFKTVLFLMLISLVVGCATYQPEKSAAIKDDILKERTTYNDHLFEIQLISLKDKEKAKAFVGIEPEESDMVPVFIKFQNKGNDPIKLDLSQTFLNSKSGENFQSLSIEASIDRARRSDAEVVAWTVGFGLIGAIASGSNTATVNRSLEEDYHAKYFKPTLINGNCAAEGLLFFNVPRDKQSEIKNASLSVLNLNSNNKASISVDLP